MEGPLVTFLVLNWNGESLLKECISSLRNSEYKNFEIIVIDNASKDRSVEILHELAGIKIIKNTINLGFAAGNNIGFKLARGRYIVTLNNDVVVDPSWLNAPLSLLEKDNRIGIISCRQMNYYHRDKIDVLFYYPTRFLLLQRMGRGEIFGKNSKYLRNGLVLGASGAAVIYRKRMLDEIGGFEGSFFAYHEESDLFLRAFYAGWKCVYVPTAVVYHKGSASFNTMKSIYYYYHERNRIWFIYRNFPFRFILVNIPIIFIREARTIIKTVLTGHFLIYLKARVDGFSGMFNFSDVRVRNIADFMNKKADYLRFIHEKIIPLK